ncbi:transcription factor MAMYB [Beta vulgaris subsp. vulgaris]|uniref:transcription factor MAMYB n=1 Tax=Beta vulgaris subsp. vulgaris TaxID=3555 RepID=UPI0020368C08|nr:transcription factor MAMYB [Beta vulgaris subsp. vulgaris]XP_019108357.2 transcription factor MAMYB [Beta vulgaris subsp. vulgaris]XP_057251005.1 transcription factor MAMYB [Beta vulgaris subsp. vulgaris]
MEFIDDYDESRPKLIYQSRPQPSSAAIDTPQNSQKDKPILILSLFFSLLFLASSFFFFSQSQILQPLFLWFSLSLLVGPFAPLSFTGGDIRVGQGRILDLPPQFDALDLDESKKKVPNKRNRGKRSDIDGVSVNSSSDSLKNSEIPGNFEGLGADLKKNDKGFVGLEANVNGVVIEEKEWSEDDLGLLRKQILKYPVGKPRRWEVIAEVFRGRHSVESVINKAKSLGKEKPVDSDSYSKFLKDRKPVDKKIEGENVGLVNGESSGEVNSWSSNEDIALLNALKVFPKDVAMRWEKIAAAVPGKSKAGCMKRVSELKKEFRSSKASTES